MALLTMTILSTALAATTSVMAWRLARREARRSDARVAALASAIYGLEGPVTHEPANAIASFPSEYAAAETDRRPWNLSGGRSFALLSAGIVVTGLLIMGATRRIGNAQPDGGAGGASVSAVSTTDTATPPSTPPSAQTAPAAPLELIALSHERARDTLIVRGAIRNPSNGAPCEMPAVVVLAFDGHGIFLGSTEAEASGESLPPGGRAAFSVSIPAGPTPPARYKVSFRSAGHVVPHVDRRAPDTAVVDGVSKTPGRAGATAPVRS